MASPRALLRLEPPPPVHILATLIDFGMNSETPLYRFATHHWSPVLGCDHPSHSDSVSRAPGPVALALWEGAQGRAWFLSSGSQFRAFPLLTRYSQLVCDGFELAQ